MIMMVIIKLSHHING